MATDASGNTATATQVVAVSPLYGDLDGDGDVDNDDLNILISERDKPIKAEPVLRDFNGDGVIDSADRAVLQLINEGNKDPRDLNGDGKIDLGDARLLDNTPPTINIIVPATVTYTVNEAVGANYNCTDAGSGVATCAGTAANGANISTSTAGNHSFSVNASDRVENASSKAVNYAVSYKVCLLYDPSKTVKSGSTVPIKIQLCDAGDTNLSSAGITVHAQSVTQVAANTSGPVTDAGNANPDCNFCYDALLGGYLFNLNTRGLATGTDNLNFTVDSDPVPHAVVFQVK